MLFELLGALYKSMGKDKAKPMNIVDKMSLLGNGRKGDPFDAV